MRRMRFILLLLTTSLFLTSCSPIGPAAIGLIVAAASGGKSDSKPPPPSGPVPPSQAANPSPSHGASSVPVTTNLSWDAAANADSYEIYFGTNALAVDSADTASTEYQGNQTATFFDPSPTGVLDYDTTYYWRVDSVNIAGTTTGNLWDFATESTPATAPEVTQNPGPLDGATSVATDSVLSWDAAAGATSYDVYFGTSATSVANATTGSAEFMGNQTSVSCDSGGMSYSATYYWRVDSRNSVGPTEGDLWSFTTKPPPPVANFTADVTSGDVPFTVSFTDASTGSITTYAWDFGDGGTSSQQNPSHTYNTAGTYSVNLTVTGPGGTDTITRTNYITVTEPIAAPVADFTADTTSGVAPLAVSFTDQSTGNITVWAWDFNNDTLTDAVTRNATALYSTPGTYTVRLTVAGPGGSNTQTKTDYITVNWPAPIADFTADATTGDAPLTVSLTDASTGNITAWEWDFDNDGTIDSTLQNSSHTYNAADTYSVSLTVTGPGGTETETKADYITVTSPPPLVKTWGGADYDQIRSLAVDSGGNIYCSGSTYSFGTGGTDGLLLMYDNAGTLQWTRTWGGAGGDWIESLAVDSGGNIYCAGWTGSFGAGKEDGLLLRYDGAGTLQWARTWGGADPDRIESLAVDSGGNIYCTGYTESFGAGSNDVLLLKYDSSGTLLWAKTWGGAFADYINSLAVDSGGNIYCVGRTDSFGAGGPDALLLKYDSAGTLQWASTWGGAGGDWIESLAVDSGGNIYCAGRTDSFGAGDYDALLLKYDGAGTLLWARTWGGTYSDGLQELAIGPGGDVYLGGYTVSYTGTWQEVTTGTKTSPTGSTGSPTGTTSTPSGTTGTPPWAESSPTGGEFGAGAGDTLLLKNW